MFTNFATIASWSELHCRCRKSILSMQTKKVISMCYNSSTNSWKPWRCTRCNLIFTVRDIYINFNLDPLTWNSKSTKLKDILRWNIPQMITKTILINARIVISCAMKSGILFGVLMKVKGNLGKNIRFCQFRGSDCRTSNSSEEINKIKRIGLWE